MTNFIQSAPPKSLLFMVTQDDGASRLKEDAKKVIEALGSKQIRNIRFRSSWVFITAKGFELPADIQRENEEDVLKFLAAGTHLSGTNTDLQMEQYIYRRKSEGIHITNPRRTREKLPLAAHVSVVIGNLAAISVLSSMNPGYLPGAQTLVVTDRRADHQPVTEVPYVHLPTIALWSRDYPRHDVDIAMPCGNNGAHSGGSM
ncbi:hypothetical protein GH733_016176 [Mirounga leonina]|nr:hypothetical protein GH733_016176 [Mirounga leonina]